MANSSPSSASLKDGSILVTAAKRRNGSGLKQFAASEAQRFSQQIGTKFATLSTYDRKKLILERAFELALREDVRSLRPARLSRELGVHQTTFRRIFDDRDAIALAVYDLGLRRGVTIDLTPLAGSGHARRVRLARLIEGQLEARPPERPRQT